MQLLNARYVLQNTYITSEEHIDDLVSLLSKEINIDTMLNVNRVAYLLDGGQQVVEIIGFDSVTPLLQFLEDKSLREDAIQIRRLMTSDIRREILQIHTAVKPSKTIIPSSENLQIRYIEVPGALLPDYFKWRIDTIFAHVLKREDIDSFLAYHSYLSSTPGVTFYVEYEGNYEDLMKGFSTPEYKDIIRQADKFIVGGNVNLSTRSYKRIYVSPNLVATNLEKLEAEA